MKFIIPIFIVLFCFACNSPSKSQASTDDSITNTETTQAKKTEVKNEPIKIGTDKILFKGFGTEPFWKVEVRKSGVLFAHSEIDYSIFDYQKPVAATSRPVEYFMTYFLGSEGGNKAQLVAKKIENCPCSDGMSDNKYDYHISFLYNDFMWEGCGSSVTNKE